jgi:hypothetical protein
MNATLKPTLPDRASVKAQRPIGSVMTLVVIAGILLMALQAKSQSLQGTMMAHCIKLNVMGLLR